jgi:hypothetical protein
LQRVGAAQLSTLIKDGLDGIAQHRSGMTFMDHAPHTEPVQRRLIEQVARLEQHDRRNPPDQLSEQLRVWKTIEGEREVEYQEIGVELRGAKGSFKASARVDNSTNRPLCLEQAAQPVVEEGMFRRNDDARTHGEDAWHGAPLLAWILPDRYETVSPFKG